MKIGIDARFLTHPQRGGFKTYTENLINALGLVDSTNTYVLYVDRPPAKAILPKKDNFTCQVVDARLPVIGMPIREQITLRRRIAQDNLDIAHFLCNTAPVGIPVRFVVTLHDTIQLTNNQTFKYATGLSTYKRRAISAYSRLTIRKTAQSASKIITVSSYEKTQIREHLGITPERICVTHLAPNALFTPASQGLKKKWRSKIDQEFGIQRRFILAVGYEPRKNIPLLLEAFSRFAQDYPHISLVIVAAEEQSRSFFQKLAREWNIDERVIILGAVSPNDLVVLYNLADVFVFPSERESFGLPPLEALACGTPVVAMKKTSIPEILQDSALLIEGKDVQTWADAIVQVITDDNLRSSLANKGIRRVARFSWERCAKETLQVYHAVLEEN
jgi:glycosyltransferase involved in cell wall biosynthesis